MNRLALALFICSLSALPAVAQDEVRPPRRPAFDFGPNRFTFGGAIGFGFGDIDWVSASPQVGYFVTSKLWVGVNGTFQYTNDKRFEPHFKSTDYGGGVFTRYVVLRDVYAAMEWSWLSYEQRVGIDGNSRRSVSALYLGAGYGLPVGQAATAVVEALYDVTGNAEQVYGTSWVIRAGLAAGF
jgi:hypothetical protein